MTPLYPDYSIFYIATLLQVEMYSFLTTLAIRGLGDSLLFHFQVYCSLVLYLDCIISGWIFFSGLDYSISLGTAMIKHSGHVYLLTNRVCYHFYISFPLLDLRIAMSFFSSWWSWVGLRIWGGSGNCGF